MKLADRWATGYRSSPAAPAAPLSMCDACARRSAWLVVGGDADDDVADTGYVVQQPVYQCGWCRPRLERDPGIASSLSPRCKTLARRHLLAVVHIGSVTHRCDNVNNGTRDCLDPSSAQV